MKQLFIIYDYDDGTVLNYYLTDNAKGCEKIMEEIDTMPSDYVDEQFGAEYPVRENWVDYFVWKCRQKGIAITEITEVESYDY